ncbi:uncharacterized protein LOC110856072 isoform X2 [Folsomia candida]|uniref:uncharacterized protein LOC110856072 isoform X2 n=1 Tax=Folsomia candida TaxID=158441 RepID=UPI001605517E|nr:uncharacterized protein LOC110856072 isoform X2 [Folsomia candida]
MAKSRCCSLESAVLFGSCAFTFDTLLKLWDLSFSVILIGYNWNKYGNLVVRPQVISAFFASVYCTFSLILAFFLFKGIFKFRGWENTGSKYVGYFDPRASRISGIVTPTKRRESASRIQQSYDNTGFLKKLTFCRETSRRHKTGRHLRPCLAPVGMRRLPGFLG